MSYLNALTLHFAGRFQADPSTVNNDPGHFDNAAFKPSHPKMQDSETGAMNVCSWPARIMTDPQVKHAHGCRGARGHGGGRRWRTGPGEQVVRSSRAR